VKPLQPKAPELAFLEKSSDHYKNRKLVLNLGRPVKMKLEDLASQIHQTLLEVHGQRSVSSVHSLGSRVRYSSSSLVR
jgi:hypothetical protein